VAFVALVACSSDDPAPGTEGGACKPADTDEPQCEAGLVCASDLCVSLGGDTDQDGESQGQDSETSGGLASSSTTGDDPATTSEDSTTSDETSTAGETSGSSDTADTTATAGDDTWCPVQPSEIDCSATCAARQAYCENCHDSAGPCSYYDGYDSFQDCVDLCEYVYDNGLQNQTGHEAEACFQYTGGSCDFPECFIDAACYDEYP
jgi:hypothetical protein